MKKEEYTVIQKLTAIGVLMAICFIVPLIELLQKEDLPENLFVDPWIILSPISKILVIIFMIGLGGLISLAFIKKRR